MSVSELQQSDDGEPKKIIRELAEAPDGWDDYINSHPKATFFHRSGFQRVIANSFGHAPHYLQACDLSGATIGILPLIELKSRLFGYALKSIPFGVYGGAIGDSPDIVRLLEDYAAERGRQLGVDYIEIRNQIATRDDWPVVNSHATFVREIPHGDAAILAGIKKKQRAVVRKSLRNGLICEKQEDIGEFFRAYSTSVRNLGTPVFPATYFQNLTAEFGDDCEIVVVRQGRQLQSALMSFYFKDQVLPFYGGGLPESRQTKAMDFMYYDLMRRAGQAGYRYFDFGRSKIDSGPYHYKRHWGFEPHPLPYQYCLVEADRLPELSVANPKYQHMIAAWRKLPLGLSQRLGPLVSKHLG